MTGNRKKILLVKPTLPYPPDQGTKIVSYGLIRTLAREYDVTVLARIMSREEERLARELEKNCARVVTVFPPNLKSIIHRAAYKLWYKLLSLTRRRSLKSLYDCQGAFVRAARKLAAESFDLVILEYWQLFPMLSVFPKEKTILLTHDIDMLVNRRSSLLERNLLKKIGKVRRWLLEQREEVYAYKNSSWILALTPRDAKAVQTIAKNDVWVDVLPVGFAAGSIEPGEVERNPREILFMGNLRAGFNLDSLEFFIQKIYPHLDELSGKKITVAGGDLPKHLAYFGNYDEVEITGHVADIKPLLHRAACLVVPLRYGGGLRIRIIEAMMAGLPIVCSSVAIAGMDFEPGKDYLLADDPKETAEAIKKLLENPQLAAEMAQNARRAVIERYGSESQSKRVLEMFSVILNR